MASPFSPISATNYFVDAELIAKYLIWAREKCGEPLSQKAFAEAIGVPVRTYDYHEKGTAKRFNVEIFNKVAKYRNLESDWYKRPIPGLDTNSETGVYQKTALQEMKELQSAGRTSAVDLEGKMTHKAIPVPAAMHDEKFRVLLADAEDSNPRFQDNANLIIWPEKLGAENKLVLVKTADGSTSLRKITWDGERIVYAGMRASIEPLAKAEAEQIALVVGYFEISKGRFRADFDEEGLE